MGCEHCLDPDGAPCFPMYGLGPHVHSPDTIIGSTEFLSQEPADGYTPDPDCPGMGTWWCPHCGEGRPAPAAQKIAEGENQA